MNSNSTTNSVKTDSGRCSDIYTDEIKKQINTLKRFREAWLRFPGDWATSLFQYADPDFYFFRFTIDRQEKSTEPFLIRVILRIMERYGIVFEIPTDTFAFVITEAGRRKGYRFEDFYMGQDVADILQQSNVDDAFILYAYKSGRPDEWIARDNAHYEADGVNLRAESLETFFKHYFGETEYNDFLKAIDQYTKDAREITGYKSIKFFSKMNLATQKAIEEKTLTDWQYKTYEYQIIDRQDPRVSDFLYFSPNLFPASELDKMVENYVQNGLYKAMVHYNGEFIFEYADGRKLNLIYDFMNNTIEFNDSGEEHYEHLLFYSVERFGLEAYEKLDEGIREEQIVYLTRNDLPTRILGLYRDGRIEEIPI